MAKEKEVLKNWLKQFLTFKLSVSMKVSEEGQLYGSVTSQMIADKLIETEFRYRQEEYFDG